MKRIRKSASLVAVGTLAFAGLGVASASSANAAQVSCSNYDFVIWGQGGVPYCFQGPGSEWVTIQGPNGAEGVDMVNSCFHYLFQTQDGKWWGPYYGINHVLISGTIVYEDEY